MGDVKGKKVYQHSTEIIDDVKSEASPPLTSTSVVLGLRDVMQGASHWLKVDKYRKLQKSHSFSGPFHWQVSAFMADYHVLLKFIKRMEILRSEQYCTHFFSCKSF